MKRYEKLASDPVAREDSVLRFWQEHRTFDKTLAATAEGPRYVFYEGPPTANGRPHFGHLMPRVYKDLFPRYKTMQGCFVLRKGGWDTHGLPVELEVEKEIGVDSKPEIEAYGVERFVEKCKQSVWRYKGEWERMIDRMGFWIDVENAYVTYTDDYIETVWWMLKTMFDRGLLYRGHKTLPYCPRCGTGLSSHEVAQGYRAVEDPSVSIRMPIVSAADAAYEPELPGRTSLLTWTTTPWTLPANVALAVAAEATYAEVEVDGERLILARSLLDAAIRGTPRVVREFPGSDLVGVRYAPPYELVDDPAAHRVYSAEFVTIEDGTGIVHTASAFGEDDYQLGREVGLPFVQPVDLEGRFTDAFPMCAGVFVKDADPVIVEDLSRRGILYRSEPYEHDYPFCWRCDTPLLYYAMDSWYVQTTAVKDRMIENNNGIQWVPAHVGEGRVGDFLVHLKDWALSRDRYWGTPLNLWICPSCEGATCIGSRAELVACATEPERAAEVELHRPYLDAVTVRCSECGGTAHRVPYVIDTWFDSGSMHTAQWHYPFENETTFREQFPADFICEAIDQTRGWFYTLLATSTIVHGIAPFRTCISTGLGLDENGLKMSKSRGNALDPWELIDRFGADAIRWYLLSGSSPWRMRRLSENGVREARYRFLETLRNVHDFFALYASIDGFDPAHHGAPTDDGSLLDRWLASQVASTARTVADALDGYDVVVATAALEGLVDDVSNWYVRLSRRRFWRGGLDEDKIAAYHALRDALLELCRLLAPFVPFLTESIYRSLRGGHEPESVHLCRYPGSGEAAIDEPLLREMVLARRAVALGHQARNQAGIRVRQPLGQAAIGLPDGAGLSEEVRRLVGFELNVESIETPEDLERFYREVPMPNFRSLGPRLGPKGQRVGAWIRGQDAATLRGRLASGSYSTEIDNEPVEIVADDVTFSAELGEEWAEASEGGVRVLLNVALDERLRERGRVRELTHRIQLARKEAGFDVTDRIALAYVADPVLCETMSTNREEIAEEVLAVSVAEGGMEQPEHTETIELDGASMTIGLARVDGGGS